jgi:hypothetical protein
VVKAWCTSTVALSNPFSTKPHARTLPRSHYLHRTQVERIAERKIRRRQRPMRAMSRLSRDLRQREHRALGEQIAFEWAAR